MSPPVLLQDTVHWWQLPLACDYSPFLASWTDRWGRFDATGKKRQRFTENVIKITVCPVLSLPLCQLSLLSHCKRCPITSSTLFAASSIAMSAPAMKLPSLPDTSTAALACWLANTDRITWFDRARERERQWRTKSCYYGTTAMTSWKQDSVLQWKLPIWIFQNVSSSYK